MLQIHLLERKSETRDSKRFASKSFESKIRRTRPRYRHREIEVRSSQEVLEVLQRHRVHRVVSYLDETTVEEPTATETPVTVEEAYDVGEATEKLETKEAERLVLISGAQSKSTDCSTTIPTDPLWFVETVTPSFKTARLRLYLRHNKEKHPKHAKEDKANPRATVVRRAICMQQNVNSDIHFFEPFHNQSHNQSHSVQRSGRSRKALGKRRMRSADIGKDPRIWSSEEERTEGKMWYPFRN
ncbi:hypothetical protein K469DRAFT_683471 [Zopfia rhizophila CBS 207.26]|uniref:Uncharacterized protein n=1 Tax=Zopfia rhizophila CBS 207.26 TaxID=1314779 RepID=A0A6A6D9L5_9PEZI|nr:hypothetical protein K469DRAFT_683471 [Zopfia rhizophila CBS 207.26]